MNNRSLVEVCADVHSQLVERHGSEPDDVLMGVISLLSDVQEQIMHGYTREALMYLNCAKYSLEETRHVLKRPCNCNCQSCASCEE